tara:strand:- start:460 stop:1215 length:756 start_codon:yes stop_codon:yes gene_type:complete
MRIKDCSKEIEIAIKAAKSAGRILNEDKEKLNISNIDLTRDTKLKADIASENFIKDLIKSASSYPILAEESGKSSEDIGDTFWVIDPLDGTANYSRNIPICCVSIGMISEMKPIFGVIYDFNNNDLYVGNRYSKISTLNDNQIYVSDLKDKSQGVLITGLPVSTDYSNTSLRKMINDMQLWKKTRMIGSAAMASCYVASGKAEMYKEKGVYLWDIVAGAAIVEAAGGLANISNIRENFQVDVIFSNSHTSD